MASTLSHPSLTVFMETGHGTTRDDEKKTGPFYPFAPLLLSKRIDEFIIGTTNKINRRLATLQRTFKTV